MDVKRVTKIVRDGLVAGALLLASFSVSSARQEQVSLHDECYESLSVLSKALLDLQRTEKGDKEFGALNCPACGVLHTRAAEAVYPFAVMFKHTSDKKYRDAAIRVGNWLIRQQQPEGQWIETPWAWTGTTADQLLMMVRAFPILSPALSAEEVLRWKGSIKSAADYLVRVMSPDFASINYCPTSAAALAMTGALIPDPAYREKARLLAHWTVAKMDEDGFIQGEAARSFGVKYGVDLGYEMDMSLWGLALYAREMRDQVVEQAVRRSLAKNLPFVYPNGAIDGSWGSRCYKWTTFGSKTADGPQILFSLFAQEDARYVTAAIRNLRYLRTMMRDGLIGNGPHFWRVFSDQLCNYPTFARAKNLALAVELGYQGVSHTPSLPSEVPGWLRYYPTVNMALARSANFMVTIAGYGYKDLTNTNGGQYNQHPTGGSACNVWVKDYGFLQTSSQTTYVRGETMHMPIVKDTVICLTPRIEFSDTNGYFTNLYEFEGRMSTHSSPDTVAWISTTGELKNERWFPGGVGYTWAHAIFDNAIEKTVTLRFHDRQPVVRIVEPIVEEEGMTFEYASPRKVIMTAAKRKFLFEVLEGDVQVKQGERSPRYLFPFPAMKCNPLVMEVHPPKDGFDQKIKYRLTVMDAATKSSNPR